MLFILSMCVAVIIECYFSFSSTEEELHKLVSLFTTKLHGDYQETKANGMP